MTKKQKEKRLAELGKEMEALARDVKTVDRLMKKYGGNLLVLPIEMERRGNAIMKEAKFLEGA